VPLPFEVLVGFAIGGPHWHDMPDFLAIFPQSMSGRGILDRLKTSGREVCQALWRSFVYHDEDFVVILSTGPTEAGLKKARRGAEKAHTAGAGSAVARLLRDPVAAAKCARRPQLV